VRPVDKQTAWLRVSIITPPMRRDLPEASPNDTPGASNEAPGDGGSVSSECGLKGDSHACDDGPGGQEPAAHNYY
jgi:hypothetical protein